MRRRHRLTDSAWSAIAAGRATQDEIQTLLRSQHSQHILLAVGMLETRKPFPSNLHDALAVLSQAQNVVPEAIADLLRRSWFGTWVSGRLRAAETTGGPGDVEHVASRLGATAAVAAHHAGIDGNTWCAASGGYVHLPGLGRLRTAAADGTPTRIEVSAGTIVVHRLEGPTRVPDDWTTDTGDWQGMRRLRVRDLSIVLDDIDPCRDCFAAAPASRLSAADHIRWCGHFATAWQLMEDHLAVYAHQVRAGVRVIVPLRSDRARPRASVSSSQQLGALAMTPPVDAASFAVTMVHEWAHSALNGLMAFTPLYEPRASDRYFVPWRPDPRPIRGALHGTFAFLSVAEAWAGLRESADLAPVASAEFALHREQVAAVLETLPGAPALTEYGRRFVGRLCDRRDALLSMPVDRDTIRWARAELAQARAAWVRRNGPIELA